MSTFTYTSNNLEDTDRLGAAVSAALQSATVVALIGTLGAGKTRLVQAIAAAEGVDPATVVSPTFVLVHEYPGRRQIFHFDAYRLKDEDEFLALGPEEYFDRGGITLVEWADRVAGCLPRDYLSIAIEVVGETQRQITLVARERRPGRYSEAIAAIAAQLGGG